MIQDRSEQDLVQFRREVYLTIMSSVDFEECAHKLLKFKLQPGRSLRTFLYEFSSSVVPLDRIFLDIFYVSVIAMI